MPSKLSLRGRESSVGVEEETGEVGVEAEIIRVLGGLLPLDNFPLHGYTGSLLTTGAASLCVGAEEESAGVTDGVALVCVGTTGGADTAEVVSFVPVAAGSCAVGAELCAGCACVAGLLLSEGVKEIDEGAISSPPTPFWSSIPFSASNSSNNAPTSAAGGPQKLANALTTFCWLEEGDGGGGFCGGMRGGRSRSGPE